MTSILDKIREQLEAVKEAGLDLSATSRNIEFKSAELGPDNNWHPSITTFDSEIDGENVTGAIEIDELVLIDAALGRQERGKQGEKSGDWMLAMDFTIAPIGARLGVMEDNEFQPLPYYGDEFFARILNQQPLIFGQLLRANYSINSEYDEGSQDRIIQGEEIDRFLEAITSNQYMTRKFLNATQPSNPQRTRLWSLEAPNRQTGNYGADLEEKVKNGLRLESFIIAPPDLTQPESNREGAFHDLLSGWLSNLSSAFEMIGSSDRETRLAGAKLVSSYTGATRQGNNVYASRATIPTLNVNVPSFRTERGRTIQTTNVESFTFWSNRAGAVTDETPAV